MKKKLANPIERVFELLRTEKRGKFLDIGTGKGDLPNMLAREGFQSYACDVLGKYFAFPRTVNFKEIDFNKEALPYDDDYFDYVSCLELIEHLENPQSIIRKAYRVLKPGGVFILTTPNILNIKSRMRFLFEGAWEYFREPLLEQAQSVGGDAAAYLHICPLRMHELEYFLKNNGFEIEKVATTSYYPGLKLWTFPLKIIIYLQLLSKCKRARKKGNISYDRIAKILLSDELLYGRHLVVISRKK